LTHLCPSCVLSNLVSLAAQFKQVKVLCTSVKLDFRLVSSRYCYTMVSLFYRRRRARCRCFPWTRTTFLLLPTSKLPHRSSLFI